MLSKRLASFDKLLRSTDFDRLAANWHFIFQASVMKSYYSFLDSFGEGHEQLFQGHQFRFWKVFVKRCEKIQKVSGRSYKFVVGSKLQQITFHYQARFQIKNCRPKLFTKDQDAGKCPTLPFLGPYEIDRRCYPYHTWEHHHKQTT